MIKNLQLVALLPLLLLLGCSKQEVYQNKSITLQGSNTVSVMPDRVEWHVLIHCTSGSIEKAHQEMLAASTRLMERGKQIGVPESAFETKGVRQGTEWEWVEGKRRTADSFFSELSITLSTKDLDLYRTISEKLFLDNVVIVEGVRFSYSKRDEAYRDALAGAIADAKTKAQFIALKAGVSISHVEHLEVDENRFGGAAPNYMMVSAQKPSASLPGLTPEKVDAIVRVTYVIK